MVNNRNNLWMFGCSFTTGTQCNEGERYYDEYKNRRGKKFSELLSEEYNLRLIDLSVPGTSNEIILYRIVESIPKMKRGDMVVIGQTRSTRTFIFSGERNWLGDETGQFSRKYIPLVSPDIYFLKKEGFSNKFIEQLVGILHTTKLKHEKIWENYYGDWFNNVIKIIEEKECRVVLWGPEMWKTFDTVRKDTNGVVDDGHFSWKGHKEMFGYLKRKINSKYPKEIS